MMGMVLRIKPSTILGAISMAISVDSQLWLGRNMPKGWKRSSNTKDKLDYLKTQGYKVADMQECDYQKTSLDAYLSPYYQIHRI